MKLTKSMMFTVAGAILLVACNSTNSGPLKDLILQTLETPTLAVKPDGATLEGGDIVQEVSGTLTLLREMEIFDDNGDYTLSLEWQVNVEAEPYFIFKESSYVANPEAPLASQITVLSYSMIVIQPEFGEEAIEATLTVKGTIIFNDRTSQATKDFLLKVLPEAVDSSNIPLIALNSDFTRNGDKTYVDPIINGAPESPSPNSDAAVVRVRGYVTGIMTDWDAAFIASGEYGLQLYKPGNGFRDAFAVGDAIEVTGEVAMFNGGRQISWISKVKYVSPTLPEPVYRTINVADFATPQLASTSQRFFDGSLIRFANLKFDAITSGSLPIADRNHLALRIKALDGANSYDVVMYMNYHVGAIKRQGIYDLLQQTNVATTGSKTFTYEGVLGWSNGPQLLPLEVANIVLN